MNKKFAILVLSCDKYSSLWKPFFRQFHKYWPDCPYKIYLGSESLVYYEDKKIRTLKSNKLQDWSTRLLAILNQIKEEYIFIWLDDIFLIDNVDTKLFQDCIDFIAQSKGNHIHFGPNLPPDGICSNKQFGYFEKGAPYRVSTVGFWDRNHLKQILLPGENPWQFEIFGSYRSSYSEGYYNVRRNLFPFIQLIERGKIFLEAYEYCQRHQIELDLRDWKIHSKLHKIRSDFIRLVFRIIIKIPWKKRVLIMNIFRKMFASY